MIKIYRCWQFILFLSFLNSGIGIAQTQNVQEGMINIGLLVPDSGSLAAIRGCELAIREANERGGLNGRYFRLVSRSMEGPWGTGSKEAVSLVFEEKVWAILGSHDGRNAHIAEQVAAKASKVFISAWSGDPTLSKAFVPWFFNFMPNDDQQAESLAAEIFEMRGLKNPVVLATRDYDSEKATASFINSTIKSGRSAPTVIKIEPGMDPEEFSSMIRKNSADCLVLLGQPKASMQITKVVKMLNIQIPLFGSIMLLNEDQLSYNELQIWDNILSVPSGKWTPVENGSFRKKFQETFNTSPGMVASFSYDAMKVLLDALIIAGDNDHIKIQQALAATSGFGITGSIRFDLRGNRTGVFSTTLIRNGVPEGSR